jgi:hypothetical protein
MVLKPFFGNPKILAFLEDPFFQLEAGSGVVLVPGAVSVRRGGPFAPIRSIHGPSNRLIPTPIVLC